MQIQTERKGKVVTKSNDTADSTKGDIAMRLRETRNARELSQTALADNLLLVRQRRMDDLVERPHGGEQLNLRLLDGGELLADRQLRLVEARDLCAEVEDVGVGPGVGIARAARR